MGNDFKLQKVKLLKVAMICRWKIIDRLGNGCDFYRDFKDVVGQ